MAVRSPMAGPTLSEARGEERAGAGCAWAPGPGRRRPKVGVRRLGWPSVWVEGVGRPGRHCLQFRRSAPASLLDPGFRRDGRGSGEAEVPRRGCVRALKVAS